MSSERLAAAGCAGAMVGLAWSVFFRTPWPALVAAAVLFSLDWLLSRKTSR